MCPSPFSRARALRLSVPFACFAGVALAAPSNLVVNGDFDNDFQLQDWERIGTASDSLWLTEDAGLDPASGSAWVRTSQSTAGYHAVLRQCIVLDEPSHAYVAGASLGVDPGTTLGDGVFAAFYFRADAACGDAVYTGGSIGTSWTGWSPMTMQFVPVDLWFVPASLEVVLGAYRGASGEGLVSGHVDAVFVHVDGLLRDGFDGGAEPPLR